MNRPVDHYGEAVRCLSQGSHRRGTGPDAEFVNPVAALTLALRANASATLAHLPEEQVHAQERAQRAEDRLEAALTAVARCVWEMSFHHERQVRTWALGLAEQLDAAGVNIDDRVDALAKRTGKGPHLFDVSGYSYDLNRQYLDTRGRRWEHTGAWTDLEVPVMRCEEPDGASMTLPDLVREQGPLHAITRPAPSAADSAGGCPF